MLISVSHGSHTNFAPKEVSGIEEVASAALEYSVSAGVYKNNKRHLNNFISADFIGLDIDEDMTIDKAKEVFKDYVHAILPTRNHQKEKNGKVCDRFRVFLQLENTIDNIDDFYATWGALKEQHKAVDPQTKDPTRQFFKSTQIEQVSSSGKKVEVKKWVPRETPLRVLPEGVKGELAKSTLKFLSLGTQTGSRRNGLYKSLRDMYQNNYTPDECRSMVYDICVKMGIEDSIDKTIDSAFSKEPRHDARIEENPFAPVTIDALYKQKDVQLEWVLKDLLPKGACSIIAGPPKAGKSTLIRQLSAAIAMDQGDFLKRKVSKGKVLYLALEEQQEVLKAEYKKLGLTGDNFRVFVGAINKETIMKNLKEYITNHEITFVVIDTLMVFSQIENPNDYKEAYAVMTTIREMARETGAHIMCVHHTNKSRPEFQGPNSIMGSNAFLGGVDVAIVFKALGERRYIQSLQRPGRPFKGEELYFNKTTNIYTIGGVKKETKDDASRRF